MNCGSINEYHTIAPRKAIVHSGKVRAVEFGPALRSLLLRFSQNLELMQIPITLWITIKKYSLKFGNLLELNIILKKMIIWNRQPNWYGNWKLHLLKLCRKEGRSFEWSVLKRWKITQHTQSLLQDILKAKFDIFFYFFKFFKFLFISQEKYSSLLFLWPFLKFPVGQSRDFDQHTALYFLYPFFHN